MRSSHTDGVSVSLLCALSRRIAQWRVSLFRSGLQVQPAAVADDCFADFGRVTEFERHHASEAWRECEEVPWVRAPPTSESSRRSARLEGEHELQVNAANRRAGRKRAAG